MSASLYQTVSDYEHLCQGDVICRPSSRYKDEGYGIIITADCDLSQSKTYGDINIVELLPADTYFNIVWPKRESNFLFREIEQTTLSLIRNHRTVSQLSGTQLDLNHVREWVRSEGGEQICADLGASKDTDRLAPVLTAFEKILGLDVASKKDIFDIWDSLDKTPKYRRDRLNRAIDPNKGQADVFFLPYLPDQPEIGYVALLRRIHHVPENLVFRNFQELARSSVENSFYRQARLTDNLRFSLVQKISTLFSRIGNEETFENELREASAMTIESLLQTGQAN